MSLVKPVTFFVLLLCSSSALSSDVAAALTAFDARNYTVASTRLADVIKAEQSSSQLLLAAAVSEFRTDNIEQAQDYLDTLFAQSPQHVEGLFLQGMVHMARLEQVSVFRKLGVAKAARQSWQQIVDVDAANVTGNYALFSFYVNAPGIAGGSLDKAKAILPVLSANDEMYAHLAKGMVNEKEGNLEAAESHFVAATKIHANRATPWFGLARFYYDTDRQQDALKALDEFDQRDQLWHDPDQAMTHFYRGTVLAKLGDATGAKSSFETALASHPNARIRELVAKAMKEL